MSLYHEMRRRYLWRRHQLEEFRYASFFKLGHAYKTGYGYIEPENWRSQMLDWRAISRGHEPPPRNPTFHQFTGGHRAGAFLHGAGFHVISEDLRSFLKANDATGWQSVPCEVHGLNTNQPYHLLICTGQCGPIDKRLSPIVQVPPPVSKGAWTRMHQGALFMPRTWDGSDLFSPGTASFIFLTERIAELIEDRNFPNIWLKRITDIQLDLHW